MINPPQANCSVCEKTKLGFLFSNRPLHKGQDITLLICPECVEVAARKLDQPPSKLNRCSWCGAQENHAHFPAGYRFCQRCVELCREIAQEG